MRKCRFIALLLAVCLMLPAASLAQSQVTYQVFVRAFADSDGDGVGDLIGLAQKLDYIHDLGADSLWLMPIFPSPSYHGYDVTDYRAINSDYGSMEDFQTLLDKAHGLGMRVLLDVPLNHTSLQHPWFTEHPEYYVWADETTPGVNLDAKVWGSKVWKPRDRRYYYALFWEGMPDLNYEQPAVRRKAIDIARYWLAMGVDGFRLDAVSHIYAQAEYGATQDPERSAEWWREFRAALKVDYPDCLLLGEAWEALSMRATLLTGLDAVVNFDVGEQVMGLIKRGGSGKVFVQSLEKIYAAYAQANPDSIDAPFLTNHDQARAYGVLGSKVERAKMAASMLLTLPGNAILYYGEEIGMNGAKPDEEIRTPMLWGGDDPLQTSWHASKYNKATLPLSEQIGDPASLYEHYKALVAQRAEHPALQNGTLAWYGVGNDVLASYALTCPEETLLVIHNFTAEEQKTDFGVLPPYSSLIQPMK